MSDAINAAKSDTKESHRCTGCGRPTRESYDSGMCDHCEYLRLLRENERMRKSLKAMYNAVYQLRGALVYINEMEEAQRILGEQP